MPKPEGRVGVVAPVRGPTSPAPVAVLRAGQPSVTEHAVLRVPQLAVQAAVAPVALPLPWNPNSEDWPAATLPL